MLRPQDRQETRVSCSCPGPISGHCSLRSMMRSAETGHYQETVETSVLSPPSSHDSRYTPPRNSSDRKMVWNVSTSDKGFVCTSPESVQCPYLSEREGIRNKWYYTRKTFYPGFQMRRNTFKLVTKMLLAICICLVISEVTFSNILSCSTRFLHNFSDIHLV